MPSETTFIVVRHGESDANSRNITSDKNVDHPLTRLGIAQAEATAEFLKNDQIDLIVSSTRDRALRTGQIINKFHNVQNISTDKLIERDYGVFSGVDKSDASKNMTKEGFEWMEIPQSETAIALDERVTRVVSMVTEDHTGKKVLISTHEDIVRSFFRVLGGKSLVDSMAIKIENSLPYIFMKSP